MTPQEILTTLAQRQKALKLTDTEVCRRAGVSGATWGRYKAGQRSPELKYICLVADALGLPITLGVPHNDSK